jgi:hypothetical protein
LLKARLGLEDGGALSASLSEVESTRLV